MLKLNLILFVSWSAIAFVVWKYRIHVHLEYRPRRHKALRRRHDFSPRVGENRRAEGPGDVGNSALLKDLESALVNLGASRKEAADRTRAAAEQGPGDLDTLLYRAMQAQPGKSRRNPR